MIFIDAINILLVSLLFGLFMYFSLYCYRLLKYMIIKIFQKYEKGFVHYYLLENCEKKLSLVIFSMVIFIIGFSVNQQYQFLYTTTVTMIGLFTIAYATDFLPLNNDTKNNFKYLFEFSVIKIDLILISLFFRDHIPDFPRDKLVFSKGPSWPQIMAEYFIQILPTIIQ